jgi:hypothetical protein
MRNQGSDLAQSPGADPKDENGAEHSSRQSDSNWDAIGLAFARIITAEETKYHAAHGKYASDVELSQSGALRDATWKMTLKFGRNMFRRTHWTFQIETSTSAQQYVQFIRGSGECQDVFFSNQQGLIYKGEPLGCP